MVKLPVASTAFERAGFNFPPERVVNLYPEPLPETAGFPYALLPVPGLVRKVALPGSCRGLSFAPGAVGGELLAVFDATLYRVSESFGATPVGAVTGGTTRVSFAGPRARKAILAEPDLFAYDGTTLVKVTDPDLLAVGVQDVVYLNGYYVVIPPGAGEFYFSTLDDPEAWAPLDAYTSDDHRGDLKGVMEDRDEMIVWSSKDMAVWVTTASSTQPFRPIPGSKQARGLLARAAKTRAADQVFFVSDDLRVYVLIGRQPQRVSNYGVESALQRLSPAEREGVELTAHDIDGHTFVGVEPLGLYYDVATTRWHKRTTLGASAYRARAWESAYGLTLAGARDGTGLYAVDPDVMTDGDLAIAREVTANQYIDQGSPPMTSVEVFGTPGVGTPTGQGADPTLELSWSDDQGQTFSASRHIQIGAQGAYARDMTQRRLGRARAPGRVWRMAWSDPIPFAVMGLDVQARRKR